jgi:hypothetical protein
MDNETLPAPPNAFRDGTLQEGGYHQVRTKKRCRVFGNGVVNIEFHGYFMSTFPQINMKALREAVK